MLPLAKILLPVDFSGRSLGAARYMEALAAHFQSEITLLHVLEPLPYEISAADFGGPVMDDVIASRALAAQRQVETFLSEELKDMRVRRVLLDGDPAQRIVEYAHSEQMDVITMPTHGHGPFRRFILGSVTAKVLHDAQCPVWTGVHLEEAPVAESIHFRSILCAVDLGSQSRKALSWAAHLASEFDARLTAMNAVPALESRPGEYFDQKLVAELSGAARQEMEKLVQGLDRPAGICVESGDPPKAVRQAAGKVQADLVVIARGSAAGVFGRLRTNAYAIIRESPCPVVSV